MASEKKPMLPSADCGSDCKKENSSPTDTNDGQYIQLLASVEDMLARSVTISQDCSIFRVPRLLREVNDKAYTPQVVSIGPLHRGKQELMGMEGYKVSYLKAFLKRTAMTVDSCLKLIRGWEERVRGCYAETIDLSSDEFAKMVLVDSCFIIESILRYHFDEEECGVFEFVRMDLILVENQLPYFVLDRIFHLAFIHYPLENNQLPSFLKLSVSYFNDVFLNDDAPADGSISSSGQVKHFVDLIRMIHLPSSSESCSAQRDNMEYIRVQTATELQEAGMKIKCATSNKSFLDMTYNNSKGVFEIPKFCVTDITESILRNMIALEIKLYQHESYIIDCVFFMDDLVDRAEDVDILVNSGVMRNSLGESKAAAEMFNNLTAQTMLTTGNYYFCPLSRRLNSYCKVPRHKWKATLKRDYFSSPIKVASIAAATILLLLTLIQTICSMVALSQKDTYIALIVIAATIAGIVITVMVGIFYALFV